MLTISSKTYSSSSGCCSWSPARVANFPAAKGPVMERVLCRLMFGPGNFVSILQQLSLMFGSRRRSCPAFGTGPQMYVLLLQEECCKFATCIHLPPVWMHRIGLGIRESGIGAPIPLFGCVRYWVVESWPNSERTLPRGKLTRRSFPSSRARYWL